MFVQRVYLGASLLSTEEVVDSVCGASLSVYPGDSHIGTVHVCPVVTTTKTKRYVLVITDEREGGREGGREGRKEGVMDGQEGYRRRDGERARIISKNILLKNSLQLLTDNSRGISTDTATQLECSHTCVAVQCPKQPSGGIQRHTVLGTT